MKIIIRRGVGGWRWSFVARNGKITANNETHPTQSNAIRAAKAVVMSVLRQWQVRPRVVWEKSETVLGTTLTFAPDIVQEA